MTAYYLDGSGLVKRYAGEPGTNWVSDITHRNVGNELFIALLTGAEVVAAVTRRRRIGSISTADAAQAIKAFKSHLQSQYIVSALITSSRFEPARIGARGEYNRETRRGLYSLHIRVLQYQP